MPGAEGTTAGNAKGKEKNCTRGIEAALWSGGYVNMCRTWARELQVYVTRISYPDQAREPSLPSFCWHGFRASTLAMTDAYGSTAVGVDGHLLGTGARGDLVALPDWPGRIRAPVHVGEDAER